MPFESKTKYGSQRDNTQLILRTLEGIKRALVAGNITADLTTVESLLTSIETELNLLQLEVWNKVVGNSTEYTYIAGTANPADFLVETILYKQGVSTIITQTLVYDVNDNVISITAS